MFDFRHDDLHALGLLTVLLFTVMIAILNRRPVKRPLTSCVKPIGGIFLVAILFILQVRITGPPVVEWLFPALSMVMLTVFVKSESVFRSLKWCMPLVALLLCISFYRLVTTNYTAAPSRTLALAKAVENTTLRNAMAHIKSQSNTDGPLPAGPIDNAWLPNTNLRLVTVEPLWHTSFSRLSVVTQIPATIWFNGGSLANSTVECFELRAAETNPIY